MDKLSDEQLVENYLKGDNQSLEILIAKYLENIYNFIFSYVKNRADAEDIAQVVFVKTWKKLKKFKPEYKFKTWLYTIAKNTALDFLKKKKAIPFSSLNDPEKDYDFSETITGTEESPLSVLKKEENALELRSAWENLAPAYKSTLELRYDEGLKFREIAKLLKEPIDTIKTRNRRALEYLKKMLK